MLLPVREKSFKAALHLSSSAWMHAAHSPPAEQDGDEAVPLRSAVQSGHTAIAMFNLGAAVLVSSGERPALRAVVVVALVVVVGGAAAAGGAAMLVLPPE